MLQPKHTDRLNGYKNKTHIYAVDKRPTSDLKTHIDCKWEDGKYIFHSNGKQNKTGVATVIPDKIDLKIKKTKRNNEGHYIMIKGSIQEEDITIVSIYAPNIGAPQYRKQALTGIRGKIITNTIIVGDVNIPLTPMDKSSIQRINKEMQILNETLYLNIMACLQSSIWWKIL